MRMLLHSAAVLAAAMGAMNLARPARAATATSLSSFEGREEPTVLYHPSNATFTDDVYTNITDQGGGVIRYTLRYQPNQDWWDGDRDTTNDDRQRAEVKGLGSHQKTDQTFRYSFDFRTDPSYIGTGSFCHVFQLKSTDGDSGAPLVTLSLSTSGNGSVRHLVGRRQRFDHGPLVQVDAQHMGPRRHPHHHVAGQYGLGHGVDQRRRLQRQNGAADLPARRHRLPPKWGLYRGINSALFVGTNWVEDRSVTAGQVPANDLIWNPTPTTDFAWNTSDSNNWIKSGLAGAFAAGNNALFTDTGRGTIVVPAGGVAPAAVNVSNTAGAFTFSGGPITGSGALTKTGAGTLTIASAVAMTGGTTVSGGTLAVNGSLGGAVKINSGATLGGAGVLGGAVSNRLRRKARTGSSAGLLSVGSLALPNGAVLDMEGSAAPRPRSTTASTPPAPSRWAARLRCRSSAASRPRRDRRLISSRVPA